MLSPSPITPKKWRELYECVWRKQLYDLTADLSRARACDVRLGTLWDCSKVVPARIPCVEVGYQVRGADEIDESIAHNVRSQTFNNMLKYFVWEVETALERVDA